MKEYTRYSVQVRRDQAWFDYFITPSLDLAKHKLNQSKEEKWEWNPDFRIVERFIIEKVVSEDQLLESNTTE
jgi:hypothetical protein